MISKIDASEALVAYLDILGYSDLVKSQNDHSEYYCAINSALGRWNEYVANKLEYASIRNSIGGHIFYKLLAMRLLLLWMSRLCCRMKMMK